MSNTATVETVSAKAMIETLNQLSFIPEGDLKVDEGGVAEEIRGLYMLQIKELKKTLGDASKSVV